jgi:hypothetical protein
VYTWDTAPAGPSPTNSLWSDLANWKNDTTADDPALAYPKLSTDTARIFNYLPVSWSGGSEFLHVITIDVADITGANLEFRDHNSSNAPPGPNSSRMRLQVNENATFNRIDWFNDHTGSGRSDMFIASTKVLQVNTLEVTGRFPNSISGPGTLRFTPDGSGAARYGYWGGTEQLGGNITVDHSQVTSMTYAFNGGSAYLEARDTTWIVGNASDDQVFTTTGGQLQLQQRGVGNPWNFIKVGDNDVDMGRRVVGDLSNGVYISRGNLFGANPAGQGRLFTDSAGNAIDGTVTIAQYQWNEDGHTAQPARVLYDRVGSNLIVNNSTFKLQGRNDARHDDVNLVWLLPGKQIKTEGVAGNADSDIIVDTTATPLSTGRLGIYFSQATLDSRGDLIVLGPRSFLNGGATSATIRVGGDVIINGVTNATGFAAVNNPGGTDATFDDFNLSATDLTLDGTGSSSLQWSTPAADPGLDFTVDDFADPNNYVLNSLTIGAGKSVTYAAGSVLWLDSNFTIAPGSTLTFAGVARIYILDPDLSEFARINGYEFAQLPNANVLAKEGVGILIQLPEPAAAGLLALSLAMVRRRRK